MIKLDTLSIVPFSLHVLIGKDSVEVQNYKIDLARAEFTWQTKIPEDSLRIDYRVYSIDFSQEFYHKNDSIIQSEISLRTLLNTRSKKVMMIYFQLEH